MHYLPPRRALHVPAAEPKSFLKQSLMAELTPPSDVVHKLSG